MILLTFTQAKKVCELQTYKWARLDTGLEISDCADLKLRHYNEDSFLLLFFLIM